MDTRNRNLLIGGAAAAVLATAGIGILIGRSTSPPASDHAGETVAQHSGELSAPAAGGEPEAAEGEHGAEVHMPEDVLKQSGVQVETLAPSSLSHEIVAQATVVSAPDGEAVLTARAAGSISAIRKRLGDAVARGETVAVVTSGEAAGLAAALSGSKARYEQAKLAFDREKRLFEQNVTARQDFEAAQAELSSAEAEFKRSDASARAAHVSSDGTSVFISSPIAGKIIDVSAATKLGAYVTPDAILFRIADPSKIQIEAAVPLTEAGRIAPGDLATIETPTGSAVKGTVRSVSPAGSAENRTASVVISVGAGVVTLQPGRFARVVIRATAGQETAGQFVLPDEAVQNVDGKTVVFVRSEEGFAVVPVQVGGRSGGRTEILSGLIAGQVVATRNAFLLKAELGKGSAAHED